VAIEFTVLPLGGCGQWTAKCAQPEHHFGAMFAVGVQTICVDYYAAGCALRLESGFADWMTQERSNHLDVDSIVDSIADGWFDDKPATRKMKI